MELDLLTDVLSLECIPVHIIESTGTQINKRLDKLYKIINNVY